MVVGLIYVVKVFEQDGSFSECIGKCTKNEVIMDFRDGLDFGVLPQDEIKPYWIQIGDMFSYRNQEPIVVVDMSMNSWGVRDMVLDVTYPSGNRGTITISEEFRQNINFV